MFLNPNDPHSNPGSSVLALGFSRFRSISMHRLARAVAVEDVSARCKRRIFSAFSEVHDFIKR